MPKIKKHPVLDVPAREKVIFKYNGHEIEGEKGYTIAAALHQAGRPWFLMDLDSREWEEKLHKATEDDEYRELWKALRRSITIKERWNPVCQRTHMPLRYRAYMPEFDQGLKDQR